MATEILSPDARTSVMITRRTLARLYAARIHPRETHEDVVIRLLDEHTARATAPASKRRATVGADA